MRQLKRGFLELRVFLILWSTQAFSALGSAMTSYALVVWSYQQKGSALTTALLSVCTYAPYVLVSIFAGALCDRWNKKKVMLFSDAFAAVCTGAALLLFRSGQLEVWHLYLLNGLNGLMNTVQKPASDVAVSLLTPKKYYQQVSGLRSLSGSLISILTPAAATAIMALSGVETVIWLDLATFAVAFLVLLFGIRLPEAEKAKEKQPVLRLAGQGICYLKEHPGLLHMMLFLAAINFTASVYNAALPAMILSRQGGGAKVLGTVNAVCGFAMLAGGLIASALPEPRSRVKVICDSLLLSMSTENFFLAFGRSGMVWCVGAVLGWIAIPIMNANMDVLFRGSIPIEMQGRVYSARNTFQFFTIPLGYLAGGAAVDHFFEPLMENQPAQGILSFLFGQGKGCGAAFLFFILGLVGVMTCLAFRKDPKIWELGEKPSDQ